jgi:hypothetical protein
MFGYSGGKATHATHSIGFIHGQTRGARLPIRRRERTFSEDFIRIRTGRSGSTCVCVITDQITGGGKIMNFLTSGYMEKVLSDIKM